MCVSLRDLCVLIELQNRTDKRGVAVLWQQGA